MTIDVGICVAGSQRYLIPSLLVRRKAAATRPSRGVATRGLERGQVCLAMCGLSKSFGWEPWTPKPSVC
jgi:hypothetical protein